MGDPQSVAKTDADPTALVKAEQPPEEVKDRPRDSKGWDGKLRLDKNVLVNGRDADADSDAEYSEDEGPPPEQLAADEDLLDDVPEDEDEIDLVHMRIGSLPALRLERFKKLKRLCLRQNQITDIELPEDLAPTLEDLDLYDNLISHARHLSAFTSLTSLDLSFNKLKSTRHLSALTALRDLYFVQNKIGAIEGLETLTNLRQLELGANRIRDIAGLEALTALEQLWLGKNRIAQIKGLDTLANLRILSIQSNRLSALSGLASLTALEELHVSHNAISDIGAESLAANTQLRVVDISSNPIAHLTGLSHLRKLQELWASDCQLASFGEVEQQLGALEELETVYFEGNPLQRENSGGGAYRRKVRLALPRVRQIDASYVRAD